MAGMIESVSTFNSFVRTVLALVAIAGAGVGGWFGYSTYFAAKIEVQRKEQELAAARKEIEGLNQKVEKLDTALRLLKVDHRVARLKVIDRVANEGEPYSHIEFVELNDKGEEIDKPKMYKIPGDLVYVDSWVVKFDDKYVEEADLERATSICLFKRIFGERQKPVDGFPLDHVGDRPVVYGKLGAQSEFETKIWADFWSIANDPERAKQLGIRAIHGEAPSIRVQEGKTYKLELRSSGGLSITPETDPPKSIKPPAT